MIENLEKTFYDVTGRRLDSVSQLKLFSILQNDDGDVLFNIFNSYELTDEIVNNSYYDIYEVENDDGWENISFKYYGTPYLGWIIALTNKIVSPFEELSEGDLIYILQPQYIYQLLKEIRNVGAM